MDCVDLHGYAVRWSVVRPHIAKVDSGRCGGKMRGLALLAGMRVICVMARSNPPMRCSGAAFSMPLISDKLENRQGDIPYDPISGCYRRSAMLIHSVLCSGCPGVVKRQYFRAYLAQLSSDLMLTMAVAAQVSCWPALGVTGDTSLGVRPSVWAEALCTKACRHH